MTLRVTLLNLMKPLTEEVGQLHAPYSHRQITGYHMYSVLPHLKPGMPLLTRKEGELSNTVINLLSSGDYTHAATYIGMRRIQVEDHLFDIPYVVEAIGKGVVVTDLATFMLTKDKIALCNPLFLTDEQMEAIAKWCEQQVGSKYDYGFDPKNKAFYCSELWWKGCVEVTGINDVFVKRTTLGVETVAPQDYRNAASKFSIPWESDKVPFHSAMRLIA